MAPPYSIAAQYLKEEFDMVISTNSEDSAPPFPPVETHEMKERSERVREEWDEPKLNTAPEVDDVMFSKELSVIEMELTSELD